MTTYIPISSTPAAALTRILDHVPKGYTRYTCGTIKPNKIGALIHKFRDRHNIHASAVQRFLSKKQDKANAFLTVYLPSCNEDAAAVIVPDTVSWLLLFTEGELNAPETLSSVTVKPHLSWLGYELVRHAFQGKTRWTWRRSKADMEGLFGRLGELCNRRQWREVERFLQNAANQPGFHGVREQTYRLCQTAKLRGYDGLIPHLYHMRKIKHGKPAVT